MFSSDQRERVVKKIIRGISDSILLILDKICQFYKIFSELSDAEFNDYFNFKKLSLRTRRVKQSRNFIILHRLLHRFSPRNNVTVN